MTGQSDEPMFPLPDMDYDLREGKASLGPLPTKKRLYQCPGCWSHDELPRVTNDAYIECSCGERMTLIDLRERREQPLNEDAH